MILFRNICIVNLLIVTCVSPILSQVNGKFWWLQKNPQFGIGELNIGNDIDVEETDNIFSRVTPSLKLTSRLQDGGPSTPRSSKPGDARVIGTPQKNLDTNEERDCVCVDYYLCDSNNTIITNGDGGILDVRLGERSNPCPGIQVCCRIPDESTETPVTQKPLKCGERGGGFVSRILNSEDENSTQFSEFPWMLALLRSETLPDGQIQDNLFQCGASLIHPQVALTAAHCVNSQKDSRLKIRAGEWDTNESKEPVPHQERNVTRTIVHPDFYSGALYNDIALLVLDQPLEIVVNVLPVCLPEQDSVFNSRTCVATGWGKDEFGKVGKYQKTLKKVEVPIVPNDVCQNKLRTTRLGQYFRLHQSFMCAGGEKGKDTCNGDGGGPLACYDPATRAYVQVGIVAWGIGCGDNGVPAVYTNVPRFRKWIDDSLLQLALV